MYTFHPHLTHDYKPDYTSTPAHNHDLREKRTFITVQNKPPDWLMNVWWKTWRTKQTATLKASPWTGLLRPGRNRWWRRSRPPTERPILYTGGQRHRQISSVETRWTEQKRIWKLLKKMAGWMNEFCVKVKSVDTALSLHTHTHTHTHSQMHRYSHTKRPIHNDDIVYKASLFLKKKGAGKFSKSVWALRELQVFNRWGWIQFTTSTI